MAWKPYNRDALINDVAELLRARGLEPQFDDDRAQQRAHGASELLSGLCIVPVVDAAKRLDLDGHMAYNRYVHDD